MELNKTPATNIRNARKKRNAALNILTALSFIACSPAAATWKPQYAQYSQAVQDWYRNAELTPAARARFHFPKCCAQSETVKTKFSVDRSTGQDVWSYMLPNGNWKRIPEDIIHPAGPTPDGQPVLFILNDGRETCFFPGEGGI